VVTIQAHGRGRGGRDLSKPVGIVNRELYESSPFQGSHRQVTIMKL
jgi:hypothetical protein